ncbi:MAG: ABC transporter substrate-binding protein [Geminicoccaceae bacterium]|nr:ABC transporter substrate-binding protein [Geminicoccaceae bacterium]
MTQNSKDLFIDHLIERGRSRTIGRRQFMRDALATGMTVSAATAMWASSVEAQTPKRGGNYRVGMHDGNTTDKLDPGTTESVYMIQLNHAMRSYLTEITNTNEIGPDAAASWEASNGARTWRFELAKGVEFHNGKEFTSSDAVDSLNFHRKENSPSAAKPLLEDIEDIRADGKHALIVEAKSGNADLPYLLSDYHLVMMPSDGEGNVDWESGIGTGPYKIEAHDPGVRTELSRHDGYFRENQAFFDSVVTTVVNDVNARQTALVTGEFDAISDVDLKTVALLGRDPNIEVDEVPSGAHVTIPMFCDTAPFDDVNVRLALKFGIDRDAVVEKILLGHGTVGNDHPIGQSLPYWANLEQRHYDPDKAKFHLKQAGLSKLAVDLSTADFIFSGAVDMAVLFKESAAACGIDINVIREPNDGYWSNVWLKKPFVVVQWGQRPTPDVMFSLAYKKGAPWNESHWDNERFNMLLDEAKAELDNGRRTEMYREMQQLCRDDGGAIVPFFRNRVYARRSNLLHGPNLAGNWELDGARSFQRWWFA